MDPEERSVRPLTRLEREILLFEATWRTTRGRPSDRKTVIRQRFGMGVPAYIDILDGALEHPEAEGLAPAVLRRRRGMLHKSRRSVAPPEEPGDQQADGA
ncbi:DUF3263 domain-containing protein [Nocardioides marmorisolisilvae]|uniref:DUF3263 domain-containing protein n=1 Tax=Nocardioides marmorisolisilvae TaxID=1542737 RepID=A0A3N0DVJ7_9ACTN|nr:DUF3263 domain-containing protein [Nocardioides marmorisolisilvae]RNL79634.1 DUF3263 domain-containing protein [Nocardioides marmorisolisilvae]